MALTLEVFVKVAHLKPLFLIVILFEIIIYVTLTLNFNNFYLFRSLTLMYAKGNIIGHKNS